jgi:hypothetical protein
MMATIYGCATLTIIALTGKNANAGLAGISVPRPVQIRETIDGHNFFTIPQELNVERSITNWSTRAWTLQEEILSMRILQFTESQVDFSCLMGSVWEGTDPDTGYKGDYPQHSAQPLVRMVTRLEMVSLIGSSVRCRLLSVIASRRGSCNHASRPGRKDATVRRHLAGLH